MQIGSPQQQEMNPTRFLETEYTIYAYHSYDEKKLGYNRWQRVTTSTDEAQAISKAEQLFKSQLYPKIEIKKKIFDNKKGRHKDTTFKIYENKPKKNHLILSATLLLAVVSAGLFYL